MQWWVLSEAGERAHAVPSGSAALGSMQVLSQLLHFHLSREPKNPNFNVKFPNLKKINFSKKNNIKFALITISKFQFSGVEYIHIVVQPMSRPFSCCRTETLPIKQLSIAPYPQPLTTKF